MASGSGFSSYSPNHIRYLQRRFLERAVSGDPNVLFRGVVDYAGIRLWRVMGISRFWMGSEQKALATRQLMADLLAGLHSEKIPTVFLVLGDRNEITILIGSFRDNEPWDELSRGGVIGDLHTIAGGLQSAFPGIFLQECSQGEWLRFYGMIRDAPGLSLITGTPTPKVGTEQLGVEQIERLIRGMYGCQWGYIVVSKPLSPAIADELYNEALQEITVVTNAQQSTAASPVAQAYSEQLKVYLERQTLGKAVGLWRVSAYCFGRDPSSFLRVRAVAQAVFGGEKSQPDPIRILDCPGPAYALKVAHLGQLVVPCAEPAPGKIAYLYHYASVLHSGELATLMHLPQEEMPGYVVRDYARFDVSPPDLSQPLRGRTIPIGEIMDRNEGTHNLYNLEVDRLSEHGLVVGVTGSGKTNTAFYLLQEAWKQRIPFLVVEPAKAEYRELLDAAQHPSIGAALRVFTLGDERISPFRLNPFQVLPGVPVQTHIDHLKDVFNASFAMYGPMPQVLEQCIYSIYEDRGWDMASGRNLRGDHSQAYPTLTDLFNKIDQVVEQLGYGPRITPELKAALKVRVNSLRIGGKGKMMDTHLSIPIPTLLKQPTVLELQAVGDDDEKAFLMGLVWIFLYEYYASTPPPADDESRIRHITLIEEAHRLLTEVPVSVNPEVANTRGKAVESFCHMLSEIRAYGEGILIADQIPSRLAADAVKNTGLKIVHRLVSDEDRMVMAGAMNLDEFQVRYLSTLGKGDAAVYAEGDDRPYLVHVPQSKGPRVPGEVSLGEGGSPPMRLLSEPAPAVPVRVDLGSEERVDIRLGSEPMAGLPEDVPIRLGPTEETIHIQLGPEQPTAPASPAGPGARPRLSPDLVETQTDERPAGGDEIRITLGPTAPAREDAAASSQEVPPAFGDDIGITLGPTVPATDEDDADAGPRIVLRETSPAAAPAEKDDVRIALGADADQPPAAGGQDTTEASPQVVRIAIESPGDGAAGQTPTVVHIAIEAPPAQQPPTSVRPAGAEAAPLPADSVRVEAAPSPPAPAPAVEAAPLAAPVPTEAAPAPLPPAPAVEAAPPASTGTGETAPPAVGPGTWADLEPTPRPTPPGGEEPARTPPSAPGEPLRIEVPASPPSGEAPARTPPPTPGEPLRVEVPSMEDRLPPAAGPTIAISAGETLLPSDQRVRDHMAGFRQQETLVEVFAPALTSCPSCAGPCTHYALARRVAGERAVQSAFARYVLTCVHEASYLAAGWPAVLQWLRRSIPYTRDERALIVLALRLLTDDHFRFLGDTYQWPYAEVHKAHAAFQSAMERALPGSEDAAAAGQSDLSTFQSLYRGLCRRTFDPYPQCSQVCPDNLCMYRFHLVPLAAEEVWLHQRYVNSFHPPAEPSAPVDLHIAQALRRTASEAVRIILADETPEQAKLRSGACFLVQKAYGWSMADQEQRYKAAERGVAAVLGPTRIHVRTGG